MAEKERDEISGVETTGHEWDGIRELNNPLPRWWLWIFYATIVYAIGYMIAYPAIPLVDDATEGALGYSSRAEVAEELAAAREAHADVTARIAATPIEEVANDPELYEFAFARGEALYRTHCSTCHGANAAGAVGFPNLQDDDWLWGGTLQEIEYTLRYGIRQSGPDGFPTAETRFSEMPAFGQLEILSRSQIEATAEYVVSLSGGEHDAELAAGGAEIYEAQCATCHGVDGGGEPLLGAPNLADTIWLYGGDRADLIETITYSRAGMMPAWEERLGDAGVKSVSIYVHDLGGGQSPGRNATTSASASDP